MPDKKRPAIPFGTDLAGYGPAGTGSWGGHARVQRAFARKAWSWGLPVWQSYRSGALVQLQPPSFAPCTAGLMDLFDKACLYAAAIDGKGLRTFPRKDCVYTVPHGHLTLHFRFADGSNPFVKFCLSEAEAIHELYAWSKNYDIMPDMSHGVRDIAFYLLSEKKSEAQEGTA